MTREEQALNGFTEMMRGLWNNQDLKVPDFEEPCKQESCEDAISRQAAIDAMHKLCDTGETLKENPWRDNPHMDAIIDEIENLPSVTPQQKTGRWIDIMVGDMPAQACDQCKTFYPLAYTGGGHRFCPNCGAKMESKEP